MRLAVPTSALLGLLLAQCGQGGQGTATPSEEPTQEVLATQPESALPSPRPVLAAGLLSGAQAAANPDCPEGMVLVEGEYCPEVLQHCLKWMDPPGRYQDYRCASYGQPECLRPRKHLRFCIDRDEYTPPGDALPANGKSWSMGNKICRSLGKRLCQEREWNFACEGEEMRPYPYGFERDATACNAERVDLTTPEGKLRDLRTPSDAFPRCVSPFGVRNLAGNLEEFVTMDRKGPPTPAMKGAYWQPSRNHCRARQTAHDRYYHGTETGFRCCSDAPTAGAD